MPANSSNRQYKFSLWTFLLGVAVAMLMVALNKVHAFDRFEFTVSDFRMYWHAVPHTSGMIRIAAIDDKSIAELGQWPWPRDVLAKFERALTDYKVAVVGFDVLFSEADSSDKVRAAIAERLVKSGASKLGAEDVIGKGNDQDFADSLKENGRTVLGYSLGSLNAAGHYDSRPEEGFTNQVVPPAPMSYNLVRLAPHEKLQIYGSDWFRPPVPILNAAAHGTGYVSIDADADGVIRAQIMVARFHDGHRVPLSLAVLKTLAGDPNLFLTSNGRGMKVSIQSAQGRAEFPINEHGQMLVTFHGPAGTFPYISIADIINHRVAPADLAGKIVLVGATARGLGDRKVTPLGGDFPGVEIHANAVDDILQNEVVTRSDNNDIERACGIALGLLMVLAASILPANLSAATAVSLGGVYTLFAHRALWGPQRRLIGVVFPLAMIAATYLVMAGYRYYEEGKARRYLRHAFEHYLHPNVIASIEENPDRLKLGGELRNVSILFADIVNYTGLSERTDPVALITMLNDYMTKMTDRIMESGGFVDKIRGDGIMAFWGAPLEVPNHAKAAVDAAIAMLEELKRLNATDERFTNVDIGIGIATGEAIAGNFGGVNRFDYSVIGDTVNLASRLEELTRKFKVHLIVSRRTIEEAGDGYIARDIGLVRVKGKQQAVPIVEVAGSANDGVDPAFYQRFARISELLKQGQGEAARAALVALQQERPSDGVVHMYAEKFAQEKELPHEITFEFDTK
jgi:adenylate cyclase